MITTIPTPTAGDFVVAGTVFLAIAVAALIGHRWGVRDTLAALPALLRPEETAERDIAAAESRKLDDWWEIYGEEMS